ncbi:Hint domain-containing protein [Paracoccus indicus]|uniref:Hint domain-containing protein n=1 Tax=Paracoccus indicus TaxID=2079229 RepID=UPI000D3C8F23|nr:Hint domain-containing protein [Paracoccus indicus]
MATTFNVINLGSFTNLDATEGGQPENAPLLNNQTFGSAGIPLYNRIQTFAPAGNGPTGTGGSAVYDGRGDLNQFSINGGAVQTVEAFAVIPVTLTYADGTTATISGRVMQSTDLQLYLVPSVTQDASQNALEAKPIQSLTFGTYTPPANGNVSVMAADRDPNELVPVIDGSAGNDTMNVGFTDLLNSNATVPAIDGNANYISGGAGNDSIEGGGGNDTILGGDGNDTLQGGTGADSLVGGAGSDTLDYSENTAGINVNLATNSASGGTAQGDVISGFENVVGGSGNDTLTLSNTAGLAEGGAGNDTITGGTGNDTLDGGIGADSLVGGAGNDSMLGGAGDDTLDGGDGADVMRGGDGNDTFLNGGGIGNDTVFGGEGDDIWRAGATDSGSDQVFLEGGNDFAEVGFFTPGTPEILDGGDGQDTIAFDAPAADGFGIGITLNDDGSATNIGFSPEYVIRNFENVRGNSAANEINGNSSDNELVGLAGNDTITGGGGNDTLLGGADNDLLDGGTGNDTLDGGTGNDTLTGGTGDDVITGGSGSDSFVYAVGDGLDTITDFNQNGETLGDGNAIDNDFLDLSQYYDKLGEMRADLLDDGILNQSNSVENGGTVDYSNNTTFAANQGIVLTGINDTNVNQLLAGETTGVVCFARGSLIDTPSGQVAIEDLQAGDPVRTMDRGFQALRWIGSRKLDAIDLQQHPKLRPVRIRAGALGQGLPVADLVVSPQHRILVRSSIAERMFGTQEVLIPANKLLILDGIDVDEDATSVEYFHMLFDQHEIVFANGSAAESLFTGTEAMRSLSDEAKREVFTLFPELENPEFVAAPARLIPQKGRVMKKLAERHQQNRAPLFG